MTFKSDPKVTPTIIAENCLGTKLYSRYPNLLFLLPHTE